MAVFVGYVQNLNHVAKSYTVGIGLVKIYRGLVIMANF